MSTLRKALGPFPLVCAILFLAGFVGSAAAQLSSNPCNLPADLNTTPVADLQSAETTGLYPLAYGLIIYDQNLGVCWLADANLAGDPLMQALMGVHGIYPDGTMSFDTAKHWVNALNSFNGTGFLNQQHWQLPTNPLDDPTCSSHNNGNFGVSCTGSALGHLYSIGLQQTYPQSIVPAFTDLITPFQNLQSNLYWSASLSPDGTGEATYSFNTDLHGANTTLYNYLYVLAMVPGSLVDPPPTGPGIVPYTTAPAAGLAVYDTVGKNTWLLNANLAASNKFGVTQKTSIYSKVNKMTYKIPLIDSDGAMLFSATTHWIAGLNANTYAGSQSWTLPQIGDIEALGTDLALSPGSAQLLSQQTVSPFVNFQPGFYWECQRDDDPVGNSQSPCNYSLFPVTNYMYSFNFNEGFLNTDLLSKMFYVTVYYPATD